MERKAIYTKGDDQTFLELGQNWNFHGLNTKEFLHSLHPYPAKFIPQIPRKAIDEFSEVGDLVYDPFCGCGTTLLEASNMDRPSIGTDNNPVAVLVSKAKIAKYLPTHIEELELFLLKYDNAISSLKPKKNLIPTNKNFLYWFNQEVLDRLSSLKFLINKKQEPLKDLLLSIFSSIIVRVSYQDSDTRYAKIEKQVTGKDVDKAFKLRLSEVIDLLKTNIGSVRADSTVIHSDSRSVPFIGDETVSLIVTSPPYLNAYDYHKYHRQRIHWIEGDFEFARDIEIGSHDEFTKKNATPDAYFKDMNLCFDEWSRVLKRGGYCVIVVGDSIVNKKPVFVADTFIELLASCNLELVERSIRELQTTKKAFNGRSRINQEHILILQKTG